MIRENSVYANYCPSAHHTILRQSYGMSVHHSVLRQSYRVIVDMFLLYRLKPKHSKAKSVCSEGKACLDLSSLPDPIPNLQVVRVSFFAIQQHLDTCLISVT